jgi:hypothetical protein
VNSKFFIIGAIAFLIILILIITLVVVLKK